MKLISRPTFGNSVFTFTLGLCLAFASPHLVEAQTIFGRISGTVTDSNRAVLPNAQVTVTNEATNFARTVSTDENGYYVLTNLQAGTYTVAVQLAGFKKAVSSDHALVADGRLTVDVGLETGLITEAVQITASSVGETVNTTSGEIARVVDQEQVQNLALNARNFMNLTQLIPGSVQLDDNQLALTTSLNVNGAQAINGNRTNTTSINVDGGNNLDSGSNNSIINNVGIDFIQEVKIQTSNFSSEYGRNSGAAVNVVTRSGSNEFHGSAFEFVRNDRLDARNFFAPRRGKLRFNDFGYAIGGPVTIPRLYSGKEKFFFFFGQEWKKIRQDSPVSTQTLPTSRELNGDFSLRLRGPDGAIGTADDGVIRDPNNPLNTCVGPTIVGGVITVAAVRTGCFSGNIIPTARLTADGRAIADVYRQMSRLASSYNDAPVGSNTTFQQPNPFDYRQDILRLDYRFNDNHSIYGRYLHDNYDLIEPFGTFIGGALPTIPTNRLRPGTGIQVSYTWLISPTLVNEAKVNTSWNGQRIFPAGETWKRDTYGFAYPQLFSGGRFDNSIPHTTVSGFGEFFGAATSLLSPTTDITISDNMTLSRNSHTLKFGGLVVRNRKDQNGRSHYAGEADFNSAGNPNSTRNALADALLGNFRSYTEASDDPIGFFRFTQYEAFFTDSWKVNRRLSLELGVRYQYGLPIYTQANNVANFVPALYDPAQAVTIAANGTIDTSRGGNRFNGLIRAGDGIPPDEVGRVAGATSATVLLVPTGAPRGLYSPSHLFAPRIGFSYSPFEDNKTAIRGGFGIFYDRPEGNIIFASLNVPPFLRTERFENGNLTNIRGGTAAAVAPFGQIVAIDPDLDIPRTYSFSLSVQRELPRGFFGEIAYVGNLGRRLLRQPDINQVPFEVLIANAALPANQQVTTNALRPFKGYTAIRQLLSDGESNYHAMQVYLAKRRGNLLLTGSYTWSKVLADSNGNFDNPEDAFNRRFSYGPTNFDRRHAFVSTYTYSVPFFRRASGFARALLGGYEISGITRFQTGAFLTPTANTALGGNLRADYVGGEVNLPNGERTVARYFNTAAFAAAPITRRGTAGVGTIKGPGLQLWDLSVRKKFIFSETKNLELRGDFFNAFNRTNFRNLEIRLNDGAYGRLTSSGVARNIQFALRFTF
jgi:Carboxypeptidase regulatory-like domain